MSVPSVPAGLAALQRLWILAVVAVGACGPAPQVHPGAAAEFERESAAKRAHRDGLYAIVCRVDGAPDVAEWLWLEPVRSPVLMWSGELVLLTEDPEGSASGAVISSLGRTEGFATARWSVPADGRGQLHDACTTTWMPPGRASGSIRWHRPGPLRPRELWTVRGCGQTAAIADPSLPFEVLARPGRCDLRVERDYGWGGAVGPSVPVDVRAGGRVEGIELEAPAAPAWVAAPAGLGCLR